MLTQNNLYDLVNQKSSQIFESIKQRLNAYIQAQCTQNLQAQRQNVLSKKQQKIIQINYNNFIHSFNIDIQQGQKLPRLVMSINYDYMNTFDRDYQQVCMTILNQVTQRLSAYL